MWSYDSSLGTRIAALEASTPLSYIADRIAAEGAIVCAHADPCSLDTRFVRAVYCADVEPSLFDLFFNSRSGYRAAYFRSPDEGQAANASVIAQLRPALLEHKVVGPEVDAGRSLTAPSAKAWLAEVDKGLCSHCAGEWRPPSEAPTEIFNGRWELSSHTYATYGRRAPFLRKLRVFGGFVDVSGQELVPSPKVRRAVDIHTWGWS